MCIFYAIEMCKTYAIYLFFLKINFLLNLFYVLPDHFNTGKPIFGNVPVYRHINSWFCCLYLSIKNLYLPISFSFFHIFHS